MNIGEDSIKKLESLQNLFVLAVLKLPHSTPLLALRAMTGMLGMRWRIWREKLLLVAALRALKEDKLAKEVFIQQQELGLPGLIQEVKDICHKIGIDDISTQDITQEEMDDALEIHHLKTTKEEMGVKQKYSQIKNEDFRKTQKFMQELSLEECCIAMRIKCFMIDCVGNMRNRYRGREECLKCCLKPGVSGPNMRETQGHLELCEGYSHLRQGKDLYDFKHKVRYFQELTKEREEMFVKIRKAKLKKNK